MSIPGLNAFGSMLDPTIVPNRIGLLTKYLARAGQAPLDWYNAIAGVGPRAELGALSRRGVVRSVMDPSHSTETTHAAERRVGLPVHAAKEGPAAGFFQGLEDFGTETLADPSFQAGVVTSAAGLPEVGIPLDIISLIARGAKAAKIGSHLERNPLLRRFADEFIHEQGSVHRAATRAGEDVVKGHESAGRNIQSRQNSEYERLVDEHREEIDAGRIPPELRQKLLQRAYREGTAGIRRKVVRDGYVPTAEEAASKPLGILTRYRGLEYLPKQKLSPRLEMQASQSPYRRIKQIAPTPGYNMPQRIGDESTPLSERLLDRLSKGAYHEKYYSTRDKILSDLGLAPAASRPAETLERLKLSRAVGNEKAERRYLDLLRRQHEAVKGAETARGEMLKPRAPLLPGTAIPQDIYDRLFGEVVRPTQGSLKDIADASREALFSVTAIPHKKNISVLQSLGAAGPQGVIRGMQYAGKLRRGGPDIEERVRELEKIGGTEHFVRKRRELDDYDDSRPWFERLGKPGRMIASRSHAVGEALDRFDTGQRLALQDALAKRGTTGFKAGGQIRDTLGDYKSKTQFVDFLRRKVGAPFPQWHLGIVPKAIGKAMVENPNATHMLARGENLVNKDVTEPAFGADFHLGGPFDEGLQFWDLPFGTLNYLKSQSVTGVPGEATRDLYSLSKGNVPSVASDLFRTYVPGGGLIEDITGFSNFRSPVPKPIAAGAGLLGSYFTKPKKLSPAAQLKQNLRDRLELRGVPKPGIDFMMKHLQLGPRVPRL